jgi:hypothetical protein
MQDSTLVLVFLSVIALASLMQAAFVAALAIGVRKGRQKVDELEERLGGDVLPRLRQISRAAEKAAEASGQAVVQAHRMDGVVQDATARVEEAVDRATTKIERLVDGAGERLVDGVRERASRGRLGRAVAQAGAFARGMQRAMDVFEQLGPTNGHGRARPEDDEDEDQGPAIPSPD